MPRYKLTIAYDGTAYNGWQRQPDPTPTVQREIEKAAAFILSHPVTVQGSSRTDTGVHALGQVAAFNTESPLEPEKLRRAINSRLPHDILIRTIEPVAENFDVRTATRKRYRYLVWNHSDRPVFQRHYVYHFYRPLDLPAMQEACRQFVGTHDFESFKGQSDDRDNTIRTIFHCDILRARAGDNPLTIFSVEGTGFLYHMVRTMLGTVLQVGVGHWQPEIIPQILAAKDRNAAGPTAPAVGLHLQWIRFAALPSANLGIESPSTDSATGAGRIPNETS
jgi:tRNA pseudouridine38-40 synthase